MKKLTRETIKERIRPMFDKLVISCDKIQSTSGIILPEGNSAVYNDIQEVLAVGPFSEKEGLNVGDKVVLNTNNFVKKVPNNNTLKHDLGKVTDSYEVILPIEEIGGYAFMLISNRDIKYVIKAEEE